MADLSPSALLVLLTCWLARVVTDIQDACDLFRTLYDRTNSADGFVSIEVSPHLAHDTQGTIAEARRLWQRVDRPNLAEFDLDRRGEALAVDLVVAHKIGRLDPHPEGVGIVTWHAPVPPVVVQPRVPNVLDTPAQTMPSWASMRYR